MESELAHTLERCAAPVFFLGGADLEMQVIRELVQTDLGRDSLRDKNLAWGARASHYDDEIRSVIAAGRKAVLIELIDDLPVGLERTHVIIVDHHGVAAGADKPSSLHQVFDLIRSMPGHDSIAWTRHYDLVAANDIGHIAGLVAAGATPEETADIRALDRKAQGITAQVEALSREAIAQRRGHGALTIIETELATSSAITDFLHPALGGPGYDQLLVMMPAKVAFYGSGEVIAALSDVPGCWYGGALPERGFWGCEASGRAASGLRQRVVSLIDQREAAG